MSKYNSTLKAAIIAAIKNNPDPKISGDILQEQLISIVEAVDKGMLFMGTATPATTPSGQSRCCLMASRPGTYTNFTGTDGNPVVVAQGEVALLCTVFVENDMRWVKIVLPMAPTSEIKVLVVGNSFVEDEFSYVPFILKNIAPSVKLTMGIAHIGGSPLAQHTAYLTAQSETYEGVTYYVDNGACYRQEEGGEPEPVHYGYHKSVGGEAWSNIAAAWIDSHIDPTIYRIIRDEQWDIVVFQSDTLHGDGAWNTYYAPYVFKITKAVFDMLNYPVKLGWAPCHSCIYSDEYSGNTPPANADELLFRRWKGRAANSIELLQQTGFSVLFPSDTAIQNLRYMDMFKSNQMSRFGWLAWDKTGHLQEGIGPLASAYANTIVILNAMGFGYESVYGEQTRPDGTWVEAKEIPSPHGYILNEGTITWYIAGAGAHYDQYCSLAQIAAVNAVKYPFSLIDPSVLPDTQGGTIYSNRAIFTDNQPAPKADVKRLSAAVAGKADVCNPISYAALKVLRDRGMLVPGTWYRITDYACSTTQDNTQSAGHAFDIIVRADDASHLNENAYATHHEGDTYFTNCKLEAWQLKYSIDNDTNRFAWADDTNGKGVVFYMKDEWNNIAPFDFKNLLFKRDTGWFGDHQSWAEEVLGSEPEADMFFYFLSWVTEEGDVQDMSIIGQTLVNDEGSYNGVYGNEIKETSAYDIGITEDATSAAFALPCTIIVSSYAYEDGVFYGCYSNKFGNYCYQNSFGNDCNNNSFGNDCGGNSFGNSFQNNTFGNGCNGNSFGNYCQSITVFDSVQNCSVTGGSQNAPVKNAQILNGTAGASSANKLTIAFDANKAYTQVAAKNTAGNMKIWNPADLVE